MNKILLPFLLLAIGCSAEKSTKNSSEEVTPHKKELTTIKTLEGNEKSSTTASSEEGEANTNSSDSGESNKEIVPNDNVVVENKNEEVQKPVAEELKTLYKSDVTYYINRNSVRVRSLPPKDPKSKILGILSLNDKVRVINPETILEDGIIQIEVIQTYDLIQKSEKMYVSTEFLSDKYIDYKIFNGKYFVVVNVATETLRLYERVCADNSCPNKMILETEVVVGEDKDHPKEEKGKGRSILGSYRVVGWTKFYQDPGGHYPAWYRDGYPATPPANGDWKEWFSKKIMPLNDEGKVDGKMRGAFGWYTAFVEPNAYGQWTHGTIGWGADKDKFIKKVKEPLINIVSDPRSSGCTRNNNEAIAFIRAMIDVGAPIIKIYAKEEIYDSSLRDYPNLTENWDYVLTKNKSHAVSKNDVLKNLNLSEFEFQKYVEAKVFGGELILDPNSPLNQIIEAGTYTKDIHPDVIPYTPGEKIGGFNRKVGRKGNVYGIKSNDMYGTFYVDAGIVSGYKHPTTIIEVGGFSDEVTPPFMDIKNLK